MAKCSSVKKRGGTVSGKIISSDGEEIAVVLSLGRIFIRHATCSRGNGEIIERMGKGEEQLVFCSSCKIRFDLKDQQVIGRFPVIRGRVKRR